MPKIPTLAGHIQFAMRAFAKLGASPPSEIKVGQHLLDVLAAELLIDSAGLLHIHFNGCRFVVEAIPRGEIYLR